MKNILIVNDDGADAKGLSILAKAASNYGKVYAAGTTDASSATSFSISINGPIKMHIQDPLVGSLGHISVDGTPIDALRLALKYYEVDFDLILTGINHGLNIAYDVNYSATVALAFEGSFNKIKSVAFSADDIHADYLYDETVAILDRILNSNIYDDVEVLSVNFPRAQHLKVLGIKDTVLGKRQYHTEYIKIKDTNKYNLSTSTTYFVEDQDSDVTAVEEGYVSITALKNDRTDYKAYQRITKGR